MSGWEQRAIFTLLHVLRFLLQETDMEEWTEISRAVVE